MSAAAPILRLPVPAHERLTPLQRQLLDDGADCLHCPLARHGLPSRPVPTEWRGIGSPRLALVGEAPGKREIRQGRPFVGPSGTLLMTACQQAGIPRRGLAILNAAACGPIPSGADTIKAHAVAACRPRLITELRRLRPHVVMAIGGQALKALAPQLESGITVVRGALLQLGDDIVPALRFSEGGLGSSSGAPVAPSPTQAPFSPLEERLAAMLADVSGEAPWRPTLFSTFHPSHILRGGDVEAPDQGDDRGSSVDLLYYFFLYDLGKAWRFAHGQLGTWKDECDLFTMTGDGIRRVTVNEKGAAVHGDRATPAEVVEAAERVYEEAREHGQLTCDVETDAKDSLEANLTAIGIGTHEGTMCATWRAWQAVPRALGVLQTMLGDRNLPTLFHNRIYDTVVLPRHGLPVLGPIGDTLLKHHVAFPGLPHKLQQVVSQFVIAPPWKDEFRKSTRDEADLILYCSRDVRATALVDQVLDGVVKANRGERLYVVDRQLVGVATHMRTVGVWIDRAEQARQSAIQHARLEYMQRELEEDFARIQEKWLDRISKNKAMVQRKKDPESYLERVEIRRQEVLDRIYEEKKTAVGIFWPSGKDDLVAIFEVLKIPFTAFTPKGRPVTDKKAMELAASRHPFMRKLLHLREANKILAVNIDGLPIKADGRVHHDWSVAKISGRWSAGKIQNIPTQVPGWPPEEVMLDETGDDRRRVHRGGPYAACSEPMQGSEAQWKKPPEEDDSRGVVGVHPSAGTRWGSVEPRPGYRWAKKESGDWKCPVENPRAILTAPTAEDVLELGLQRPDLVHPQVLARALQGHGRILVGADQEQLELRIAAQVSADKFLLDIFDHDRDPHAEFARVCFPTRFPQIEQRLVEAGIKPKDLDGTKAKIAAAANDIERMRWRHVLDDQLAWKKLRDVSKNGEYGGVYGARWETIWEELLRRDPRFEASAAKELHRIINETLKGVVAWRNRMETEARTRRVIREKLLGRARYFPFGNFNASIVYNHPIQAFGASLIALCIFRFISMTMPELLDMDELYRWNLLDRAWVERGCDLGWDKWQAPVWLLVNGHDSLTAESDDEDGDQCCEVLEASMTHEITIDGIKMKYIGKAQKGRRLSDT